MQGGCLKGMLYMAKTPQTMPGYSLRIVEPEALSLVSGGCSRNQVARMETPKVHAM